MPGEGHATKERNDEMLMRDDNRTPRYRTPDVNVGTFQGESMIEIGHGRRSVLIRPSEAQAVVNGMSAVAQWIHEHNALHGHEETE